MTAGSGNMRSGLESNRHRTVVLHVVSVIAGEGALRRVGELPDHGLARLVEEGES